MGRPERAAGDACGGSYQIPSDHFLTGAPCVAAIFAVLGVLTLLNVGELF